MALTDSTHETSSRLVKLLVEVRGNSEEVISMVTFLTKVRKVILKMGEGVLNGLVARKNKRGFQRGKQRSVDIACNRYTSSCPLGVG